ncbi:MAG: serine/threonine-protein kinase [Ilumatobacter sp.]|jgi:eukaryotic-like serine/threonine-protein kinase|uniref:serine/threonine-protein kinase n=1 Tax=Ilumatobacter sp. TaxID=1967498 RepID=UPI00391BFA8E
MNVVGFDDLVRVGSGGIGDVYRATRASTGTVVAIKELRADGNADARLRRANRELTALASLRGHPYVVNLEEVVRTPAGAVLLVMEYSPGGSLDDRSAAVGGMLPFAEVLLVGSHASDALAAAHEAGIVHRDIKPQNLLVGTFGQVKVCDFGIASIASSDDFATKTNAVSYRYASPEELRGDATVTPTTDVYSLGVTLAKLLTNRHFNHETAIHLADVDATPGLAGDATTEAERELRRLLQRCLAHRATARPTANELQSAIDDLAASLGSERLQRLDSVERPAATHVAAGPPTRDEAGHQPGQGAGRAGDDRSSSARTRSTAWMWSLAIVMWLVVAVLAVIYLSGSADAAGEPIGAPPHATVDLRHGVQPSSV